LGWWLLDTFADCVKEARDSAVCQEGLKRLEEKYDAPGRPFVVHLAPGVGTFEQYAFIGSWSGASADGRAARAPVGSDLSPAPTIGPPAATAAEEAAAPGGPRAAGPRRSQVEASLRTYAHPVMARLGDGAPVDYNVREAFPQDRLVKMIRGFAGGNGGSICTFTVGDPETFAGAQADPERYNLVRVRMGGWTEFFVALFPHHQEQHKRRPLYV
jgi:pyruvate-formate lyase